MTIRDASSAPCPAGPLAVAPAAEALAAPEFLAWARSHARARRRHAADLAQITTHPQGDPTPDAIAHQKTWARRRTQERVLHHNAIDQIRPKGRP